MYNWFINLNYITQALIATLFTYFITLLGSAIILLFKNISTFFMNAMMSFSAGIMLSASYFSLISPAIDNSITLKLNPLIITTIGLISGAMLLYITDIIFDNVWSSKKKRAFMLFSSITIHNIPEGLAVGIAFGSTYYHLPNVTTTSALLLAIGIAMQNFPEGSAVSIPLAHDGMPKTKAFFYGQLSAIVEPIFGVLGAILVLKIKILLPFFLSFAAGAMLYVIISELIPESQNNEKSSIITIFNIIGFIIMMILDLAFS